MTVYEVSSDREFADIVENKTNHGKQYVFVDFYADWCGPCKRIAPELEKMSEVYGNKIFFCKVNIETQSLDNVATAYEIESLPTFMVFDSGNLDTKHSKIIGADKTTIDNRLKALSTPISVNETDF